VSDVPAFESQEETIRGGNAFNLYQYDKLGVTKYHVVSKPDACSFCQNLNGKVVSVHGTILAKNAKVPDGYGNIRVISKDMKHPPFHRGCECGIAPGE
jgi:hypothetical protein